MVKVSFEELQKENLSYMEEAEIYRALMLKYDLTQEELALRIGKDQSTVANKVRLLKLPHFVREVLKDNNLTERHARALLKLHDEQLQLKVLKFVCERGLNVKKVEDLVEMAKKSEGRRDFTKTIKKAIDTAKELGINIKAKQIDMGEYNKIVIQVSK
jgi:ParB family chromosome partitioning protein